MIKNIIFSAILLCLFIAIPLAIAGVTHVDLGGPFLALLKNTSRELNDYKIAIPNIPEIPPLENVSGFWAVIDVLVKFVNALVKFLNFFVTIINVIIQLFQYIFLVIKNLIVFKDSLVPNNP